jgi:hypothetical protein
MPTPNIPPNFDITLRVGCSLVYEVTGTASLLLNLKLRPDPNHVVFIESLALGNNLPAHYPTFQDSLCAALGFRIPILFVNST